MQIFIALIILIIFILIKIYRFAMRQSEREKEFWLERKMFYNDLPCKIYKAFKVVLLLIAIFFGMFIFLSLAYGKTPTMHDLSDSKLQEYALGLGIIGTFQTAIFGGAYLLKQKKYQQLKIFLFFTVITVCTVILILAIIATAY